ncbi:LysR substrate-binding domain-containing protein, partial [Pseudomonas aeruginosa]
HALRDGGKTLRGHEAQVETVRVGVLSTVESLVVPEVIRRLHRRHGALVVSVATGPSAYLLAQLKVGEQGVAGTHHQHHRLAVQGLEGQALD